jgi:hypothetical protein
VRGQVCVWCGVRRLLTRRAPELRGADLHLAIDFKKVFSGARGKSLRDSVSAGCRYFCVFPTSQALARFAPRVARAKGAELDGASRCFEERAPGSLRFLAGTRQPSDYLGGQEFESLRRAS